ncbi:MAG: LamG domain-containing protein, partial [Nanoarchaeota archaeon]
MRKRFNRKQERIYFSLGVAIILLSLVINITSLAKTQTSFLINNEISFPINKDSEKIKDGFNLITGYVAEEIYSFGLPMPVDNTVTSTSTTSTSIEGDFGIPNETSEPAVPIPPSNETSTTLENTFSETSSFSALGSISSNYGNLSISSTGENVLLSHKSSGLEKYLFYNISYEKISSNLSLTFNVNRTVYNYLKNCYETQTVSCCNTIKTYIEDDYPTATCKQINDTLFDYIDNGWRIYQNGVDNGIINTTKNVVTITIPNRNHLDEVRLGKYSLIYEYQDVNILNYNSEWFDLNFILYVNISNEWKNYNDVWLRDNSNNDEFGANWTYRNKTTYFLYQFNSTNEIKYDKSKKYYIEKIETNPSGGSFTETHNLDFSDICNGNESFSPNCNFNLYNIDRGSFIEYILNVTFYDNTGFIDPTISVDTTTSAQAIDSNITREANFNHLTVNDSSLLLYLPFDTNTSTTKVYDYTEKNNDGTITGSPDGIRWNNSGYIGGAFMINQSIKSYIQLPDLVAGQKQITVNVWFKSDTANTSTSQTILEQVGAGRDPILMQRNNVERYTFLVDNGTVQSTATINYDATLVDTDWHMITGAYNGTDFGARALIYIHGVLTDTGGTIGGNITGTAGNNLFIGADSTADSSLNGTIDEVMIWNRSLSAQEITDLYNNQSARFYTQGRQEFFIINMTQDQAHDRANITYYGANLSGSYLQSRLGQWNITYGYNNTDTGLVGYWHFDNQSTYGENDTYVVDFAMNQYKNNGTFYGHKGGTLINATGPTNSSDVGLGLTKFGGSFKFDRIGDYVNIGRISQISATEYTITAWIKKNINANTLGIINAEITGTTDDLVHFYIDSSNDELTLTSSYSLAVQDCSAVSEKPVVGEWAFVAAVVSNSSQSAVIYKDGASCGSGDTSFSQPDNNFTNTYIGIRAGYLVPFNGTIDEVMIWNRSLSAAEIKSLYIKGRLNYDYTNA